MYKIRIDYDPKEKLFVPMYKKHWWNRWHPWHVNYFVKGYKTATEAFEAIKNSKPYCYAY